MSKAIIPHHSTAPAGEITQHVENVRRYGAAFDQAASQGRQAMHNALLSRLLAGAALVALKNVSAHGEFEELCKREFPTTPERTLQNWKARAELDLRNTELKRVTLAVLLDAEDAGARGAFEAAATKYFAAKPTVEMHAARDILQLGNGRHERKASDAPPKPRRELKAEEKRKAECAKVLALWDDLFESLNVVALPRSIGTLGTLPARELRKLKRRWEHHSGTLNRQLKAIKD